VVRQLPLRADDLAEVDVGVCQVAGMPRGGQKALP
jgi:hypothetical protein